LLEVRYAIDHGIMRSERDSRWEEANDQLAKVISLGTEVAILGRGDTKEAADTILSYLNDVRRNLYRADRDGPTPRKAADYREDYLQPEQAFISAARRELRFEK
jgi:hypothetical protein